jgi:6-pyruvoyltetrahydropterin/6-carboxytetrahydropterin synthase
MRLTTFQRFEFSAAHQLRGDGRESRLHGHNFAAWVGVSGARQPGTGVIVPRADLRATVNAALDRYDHRHLNAILGEIDPTNVNIAHALWADLNPVFSSTPRLTSLTLLEEDNRTDGSNGR